MSELFRHQDVELGGCSSSSSSSLSTDDVDMNDDDTDSFKSSKQEEPEEDDDNNDRNDQQQQQSRQRQSQREPLSFVVYSSETYISLLKLAQYLACVCLALMLYVEEFFQSHATTAKIVVYFCFVAAPAVFIHLPLYVEFLCRLSTSVRSVVWSCPRYRQAILLEGGILAVLVLVLTPLAVYYTMTDSKENNHRNDDILEWLIFVPGSTLSVVYYFLSFTSFRHYKLEIMSVRPEHEEEEQEEDEQHDCQWARSIQERILLLQQDDDISQHQQTGSGGGAYKVFGRLMMRFPAASAVAWISTALYTSCLPLQGLTVGSITQTIAEATPESTFWELFQPGLYFLLTSAGMAVFLWTTKLGFARFGAAVEEYYRLQMTASVCGYSGSDHSDKSSIAATLEAGDLSSRYARDLALISNFIDKNKLFTSAGILGSSIVVLFTVDWRMGYFFAITCPALIMMLAEKPGQAHKAGTVAAARLQGRFENCVQLRRTMDLYDAGEYVYTKSATSMKNDMQAIGHSKWVAAHFVSMVHATGLAYTSLISLAFLLFSIPLARTNPTVAVNHLAGALVILSQLKSPFSQIGQGVEHWLSIAPALFRLDQFCHDDDHRHHAAADKPNNNNKKRFVTRKNDEDDEEKGCSSKSTQQWGTSSYSDDSDSAAASSLSSLAIEDSVELQDIHFRYSTETPNVLCGVNAKLETGKYTCIVGCSGAGKSTLLNILTRELVPTAGSIILDGQHELMGPTKDNAALLLEDDGTSSRRKKNATLQYRKPIAIVFQSATFFDGTIAENIRLGMPTASNKEVAIAAERAQCTFLKDLPDGLNTRIGGGGGSGSMSLSGGQGQRVCLARALVRNPRLLILDEATSALDPHTEEEAVKTFVHLAHEENVAVVSVTHRLDTTEAADKVIVLENGVVAEDGSPKALHERKGLFYDMRRKK